MARYGTENLKIPHKLDFTWAGWPTSGTELPKQTRDVLQNDDLIKAWQGDDMKLTASKVESGKIQLAFSTTPKLAPIFITQRAKGRLQHAMRQAEYPIKFSRKVALRSLGDNKRNTVEKYIANQAKKAELADPKFVQFLNSVRYRNDQIDLKVPSAVTRGRYWYNLHIVLVTEGRYRIAKMESYPILRDAAVKALTEAGNEVGCLSVMPDHIHAAIKANVNMSPLEIGVLLQNETAAVIGCRAWQEPFYAGTFSEYDLRALAQSHNGLAR